MPFTRNKQRKERLLKKHEEDMKLLDEFAEENKKMSEQAKMSEQTKPNDQSTKQLTDQTKSQDQKTEDSTEHPLNDLSHIKNADEMAKHMSKIYQLILLFKQKNPDFENETDKKKVDIITTKLALGKIIEEFPIVTRYMICFGQFSEKAFREFLRQCENSKDTTANAQKRGYRDDKWCQLQANYVTLLWKEYNKHRHPSEGEKKMVWTQTYKLLKKSFTDMKNKQKEAEKQVKEEKQMFIAENLKEYLERIQSGKQSIPEGDEEKVRIILEQIINRGKMKEVLNQLKTKVPEIEPVTNKSGRLPEHEAERRQRATIRMTETVDAERMQEIPDKYKPEELKGMEMVNIPEEQLYGIEVEEYVDIDAPIDSTQSMAAQSIMQTLPMQPEPDIKT